MHHLLKVIVVLGAAGTAGAQTVSTAQYGNQRLGANTHERTLTPRNVNPAEFGRIAALDVDGDVYAQPLYVRDTLIVATEAGSVYAFDARRLDTRPIWRRSLMNGGSEPLSSQDVLCPFIRPTISITPTPAIDTVNGIVYLLARSRSRDARGRWQYAQKLHAVDLRTGNDVREPVEIQASIAGTGAGSQHGRIAFDPLRENPRAALLLDRGVIYIAWASSCDVGPYHGWIMAYEAQSLKQLAVFNTSPNGGEAGVWQSDAGLAADADGNVYAVTGNGTFGPADAPAGFGSSILALRLSNGSFAVRDYFTPSNEAQLSREDADLGSGGPMVLPVDSATRRPLVFVSGKDGTSYVVDRTAMGHFKPGNTPHARQAIETSGGGFGASAYWNGTMYVWGTNATLAAYHVVDGRLTRPVHASITTVDPGVMPVVSANGTRDAIVWGIETRTWRGADKPAILHAFDASDVRRHLYSSEMNPGRDRAALATRFAIPTVANGRVFVAGKSEIDVYGLLPAKQASRPHGTVEETRIASAIYGRARRVWLYTPPSYPTSCAPDCDLLIAFDGGEYRRTIDLPMILDSLTDAQRIRPTVAVLIDNSSGSARLADLANRATFAKFVSEEVVPWVRQARPVTTDPRRTVVTGSSVGGLAAAYLAFRRPDLFGNVLSQSGAFWRGNEASNDAPYEWLTTQFAASPKKPLRFLLDVGSTESGGALGGAAPSILAANRKLRDVLMAKGYSVLYTEVPGGEHAPASWGPRLALDLVALRQNMTDANRN